MPAYKNSPSSETPRAPGSLPANCDEIALPERSRTVTVFPRLLAVLGTEIKKTWCTGSKIKLLDDWGMVVKAKLVPPAPVPAVAPTKNDDGFDVPLGSTMTTWAAPPLAIAAAGMVAESWLAEMKVVVSEMPLNFTTEEAVKCVPFTVRTMSAPPATAEPGLREEIIGVVAPGATGAGGVGKGVAGGIVVETGLMKLPPTRNMCPSLVLKAKPFSPQRTSRPAVPFTPGIVMEPLFTKCVRSKASIMALPLNGCSRKYAALSCESTTISPEDLKVATGKPVAGSRTAPFSP